MKTIGIVATTILVVVFSIIYNGFALSVLWGWFIVPSLGAPALTVPYAIGVAMVVAFLTEKIDLNKKDETPWGEKLARSALFAVIRPSFTLFIGWIVTLFI